MTTIEQAEVRFVELMAELFQLDEAERLDFGFYRVIRHHNQEVKAFLGQVVENNGSKALEGGKLSEILAAAFRKADDEESAGERLRLKEIEGEFGIKPGMNDQERRELLDQAERFPGFKSKVDEYRSLQEQLRSSENVGSDRREVLNRLYQFFSRHYQDGDFIVERRYGRDGSRYIRSTGEDTEFHWATEDMYYIKSGDTFTDFTVRLSNGERIVFSVEPEELQSTRANLKPTDKAHYEIDTVTKADDGRHIVLLKYLKGAQSNKQKEDIVKAIQEHINADETELKRWLNHFVARNQSDFFIHKRLGAALREDLDIFLKTEVLNADQLLVDTDLPRRLIKVGRIVRDIGHQIIDFLAVLEEFQKSLWEKKKLVFNTRYVISLDRIAKHAGEDWLEAHLPEIITAQRAEWKELGLGEIAKVDQCREIVPADLAQEAQRRWLPLPLDTKNIPDDLTWELLARCSESRAIDELLDGIAVRSDNWQALNLLETKFSGRCDVLYADPPYNTDAGPISYKNGYRRSSWAAMMQDRVELSRRFLGSASMACFTIDDFQKNELIDLLERSYTPENLLGITVIKNSPSGRPTVRGFRVNHEYGVFVGNSGASEIGLLDRSEAQEKHFGQQDEKGQFAWENFRKRGGATTHRDARPKQYYPIYVKGAELRIPEIEWVKEEDDYRILEAPKPGEKAIYPKNDDGTERVWSWGHKTARANLNDLEVRTGENGPAIYRKARPQSDGSLPSTLWTKPEYSAVDYGSVLLKEMFGKRVFSFPKSVHAVVDTLRVCDLGPDGWVIDCFAGSGTTAHAVLSLNKSDGETRKFVITERSDYFETLTLPRIMKAAAAVSWKKGKADALDGNGVFLKAVNLEDYEDTLENLALVQGGEQDALAFENLAFSIQYRLDREARKLFQSVDHFRSPFGYSIKCAQGGGEAVNRDVDLVESLIYLLGLDVARLYREDQGVVMTGTDRRNRSVTVLFRECDREGNEDWCKTKLAKHSADRFLTNAMPELAFEGCERFEAIEAIFATQFGGR